jgi:hypothetical protein
MLIGSPTIGDAALSECSWCVSCHSDFASGLPVSQSSALLGDPAKAEAQDRMVLDCPGLLLSQEH